MESIAEGVGVRAERPSTKGDRAQVMRPAAADFGNSPEDESPFVIAPSLHGSVSRDASFGSIQASDR